MTNNFKMTSARAYGWMVVVVVVVAVLLRVVVVLDAVLDMMV